MLNNKKKMFNLFFFLFLEGLFKQKLRCFWSYVMEKLIRDFYQYVMLPTLVFGDRKALAVLLGSSAM